MPMYTCSDCGDRIPDGEDVLLTGRPNHPEWICLRCYFIGIGHPEMAPPKPEQCELCGSEESVIETSLGPRCPECFGLERDG